MSTITKEWLRSQISAIKTVGITDSNTLQAFEIALASLEAEPVAEVCEGFTLRYIGHGPAPKSGVRIGDRLYTAPPAPVSVPDEEQRKPHPVMAVKGELGFLDHFERIIDERDHDIEIGQLSSSNGEALMLAALDAFRAAMLQGADRPQNEPENIPATQFKPVADLYGLTSPTGSETSFTFDAVEARDFVDGGWSCQEYVELERFQEAVSGNFPVIPDGWVACSERMPEQSGRYWCYVEEQNDLGKSHYQWNCSWNGDRWWVESENGGRVTHWMPLPAAPQQEVK
jgi:hypothetical protein